MTDPSNAPLTFPALVDFAAGRFGDREFLPRRDGQGGDPVSFSQLRDDVRSVARALLHRGVQHGDRIALIAENSYHWLLADLATTYIGAVDVPRGVDTAPAELHQILRHSGCRYAFGETAAAVTELRAQAENLDDLEQVFGLTHPSTESHTKSIVELEEQGRELGDEALDAAVAAVKPEDLATIVYTSGTTAEPKGVMLTHSNLVGNAFCVNSILGATDTDVFLSVLPAWHVYERILDYLAFSVGGQLVYTTRRKIKEDLKAVQPTVFAAVPRIWESIHDGVQNAAAKLTGVKGKMMRGMLANARSVGCGRKGFGPSTAHRVYRRLGLHRKVLHAVTGGKLRIAVSGGGALPSHVDATMLGMGMPLLNGYGLTETSPVVAVRPPGDNRVGTIGPVLPNTEIHIRDTDGKPVVTGETGVIWIRGPQVMRGYYNNEEKTQSVLQDGWFNSGDLGCLDPNGHYRITGRAKDTIVLAGGENVEPEPVETGLKASSLIDQVVVLGQDRRVLGAIVIPTTDFLEQHVPRSEWGEKNGELTGEKVVALYRQELDRALTREAGFRPVERVAKFRIRIEPMTIENGLLTPTMKIKRHEVQRQMSGMIQGLFE